MSTTRASATDGTRRQRRRRRPRRRTAARRLAAVVRDDLPAVVRLLDGTAVEELRIEQGHTRLVVRQVVHVEDEAPPSEPPSSRSDVTTVAPVTADESAAAAPPDGWTMTSPCVGIFRAGPRPGATAQTQVGTEVDAGHVLGYIEAMGIMNEVEAGHAGRVTDILVAEGQPVEFGQPLFVITPTD